MKPAIALAALAGLALAVVLVVYFGWDAVASSIATAGISGLALVVGVSLLSTVLCAFAWRVLLVDRPRHATEIILWARYVRDCVGNTVGILPAVGEIVAAREASRLGVRASASAASTIVDLTAEILSQVVFTVIGLAVLIAAGRSGELTSWLIGGIAIAAIAVIGFVVAQHRGLFHWLERLPERIGITAAWAQLPEGERLNDAVGEIYAQSWRMPASVALHLGAWFLAAVETLVALRAMGIAVDFDTAVALESLVFAARTSAFVVPWAAGVQEGGYVLIGGLLGIAPQDALALSLLKRARELIVGVPGVVLWHLIETRRIAKS